MNTPKTIARQIFSFMFLVPHFTASQLHAAPNGVCRTTLRIPLTIVPSGAGSLAWQFAKPSPNFTPGSGLPTGGGTGVLDAPAAAPAGPAATTDSTPPRSISSSTFFFTVRFSNASTSSSLFADTSLNSPIFSPGCTPRCRPPDFSLIMTVGPSPIFITPYTAGSGGSGLGGSGGLGGSTITCELRSFENSMSFAIPRYAAPVTVGGAAAGGGAGGAGTGGRLSNVARSRA